MYKRQALAGVGAVVMYFRKLILDLPFFTQRTESALPVPVTTVTVPSVPRLEQEPPPPGMTNLPEGFTGFDDDW